MSRIKKVSVVLGYSVTMKATFSGRDTLSDAGSEEEIIFKLEIKLSLAIKGKSVVPKLTAAGKSHCNDADLVGQSKQYTTSRFLQKLTLISVA